VSNFFVRQSGALKNDINRSLGALLGIAQGMLCDGHLNDQEISFLQQWLTQNESIAAGWPGDVVHARVREALADGVITAEERTYLTETLQQLVGGSLEEIAEPTHVTEMAIDRTVMVSIPKATFCLTGDFVFAPRSHCELAIQKREGIVSGSVTKKLTYLVVGGLGSKEWKHGSFGTKVEKAFEYKRLGHPILVVHEDQWASAL
jgi:NAD-dependent DNA ligase